MKIPRKSQKRHNYYDCDEYMLHSASRHCLKQFDPNGWPTTPSLHICTGNESFYANYDYHWNGFYSHIVVEFAYEYEQPSENFPVTTTCIVNGTVSTSISNLNTCTMPLNVVIEPISHTISCASNSYDVYLVVWEVPDPDAYQKEGVSLSNEYTDGLLLSYTAGDLGGMADWDGLNWGQRWARDEHRQTPYAETLPTNELYSIHLMATNRASLQLQKLRYRWSLPSVSGVVFRVFWWEKFIPANGGTGTSVVQRTVDVLGTGGTVYTPAFDLPPPSAEGCTYPAPMESILKVEIVSINPDAEILCKSCDLIINAEASPAGRSLEWTIESDSTGGASLSSSSGSSTVLTVLETANNGVVVVRVADAASPLYYDEVEITVWGPQGYPPRQPNNARFFAGRTEAEIDWAMRHPICARRLRNMNIDRLVFAEVHRVFPNANCARDPNVGNAFQHAFLMCRVAQICNANTAAELGDAHEEYAQNDCRAGHAIMDFHNNGVGVQASMGCSDCTDCILDAIRNGATRWMGPPPSMPPTPACDYEFTGHTNGILGNPCIPAP